MATKKRAKSSNCACGNLSSGVRKDGTPRTTCDACYEKKRGKPVGHVDIAASAVSDDHHGDKNDNERIAKSGNCACGNSASGVRKDGTPRTTCDECYMKKRGKVVKNVDTAAPATGDDDDNNKNADETNGSKGKNTGTQAKAATKAVATKAPHRAPSQPKPAPINYCKCGNPAEGLNARGKPRATCNRCYEKNYGARSSRAVSQAPTAIPEDNNNDDDEENEGTPSQPEPSPIIYCNCGNPAEGLNAKGKPRATCGGCYANRYGPQSSKAVSRGATAVLEGEDDDAHKDNEEIGNENITKNVQVELKMNVAPPPKPKPAIICKCGEPAEDVKVRGKPRRTCRECYENKQPKAVIRANTAVPEVGDENDEVNEFHDANDGPDDNESDDDINDTTNSGTEELVYVPPPRHIKAEPIAYCSQINCHNPVDGVLKNGKPRKTCQECLDRKRPRRMRKLPEAPAALAHTPPFAEPAEAPRLSSRREEEEDIEMGDAADEEGAGGLALAGAAPGEVISTPYAFLKETLIRDAPTYEAPATSTPAVSIQEAVVELAPTTDTPTMDLTAMDVQSEEASVHDAPLLSRPLNPAEIAELEEEIEALQDALAAQRNACRIIDIDKATLRRAHNEIYRLRAEICVKMEELWVMSPSHKADPYSLYTKRQLAQDDEEYRPPPGSRGLGKKPVWVLPSMKLAPPSYSLKRPMCGKTVPTTDQSVVSSLGKRDREGEVEGNKERARKMVVREMASAPGFDQ